MVEVTNEERRLLERLGAEGNVTALKSGEISAAMELEKVDLVFLVRDGTGGAVITPKGRRLLAALEQKPPKRPKPPSRLLE